MNNKKMSFCNLGYLDKLFNFIKYLNSIFWDYLRFINLILIMIDFFKKKIHRFSGMLLIELKKIFKSCISFLINKLILKIHIFDLFIKKIINFISIRYVHLILAELQIFINFFSVK